LFWDSDSPQGLSLSREEKEPSLGGRRQRTKCTARGKREGAKKKAEKEQRLGWSQHSGGHG
jgi:hypothetical protein